MRNKNNPLGATHTTLPRFNRSQFNISPKQRISMNMGGFFPVKVFDIVANTSVNLKTHIKLDSFPAVSPLYGTVKLRYDVFFCPYRNYVPNLSNNNINDTIDIDDIALPQLRYINNDMNKIEYSHNIYIADTEENILTTAVTETTDYIIGGSVTNGSVLDYLGYPQMDILFGTVESNNFRTDSASIMLNTTEALMAPNYQYDDEYFIPGVRDMSDIHADGSLFNFSLVPWLAYIDCYRMYVANPQDRDIPIAQYLYGNSDYLWEITKTDYFNSISISDLDNIISLFRDTNDRHADFNHDSYNIHYDSDNGCYFYRVFDWVVSKQRSRVDLNDTMLQFYYTPFGIPLGFQNFYDIQRGNTELSGEDVSAFFHANYNNVRHNGILPSTYLPDYFNSGIDVERYQQSRVQLTQNMFVESLRRKEREWYFNVRNLFTSYRYTDYNYIQYGSEQKLNDMPIALGGDTIDFNFQDILSQSNATYKSEGVTDYVGGTAGRASFNTRAFNGNPFNPIKFTARENGVLLVCARLVPEVDYDRGVPKYLLKTKMSDFYKPINDGVGFDDIFAMELDASVTNYMDTIWKVPIGWEHIKDYNGLSGLPKTDAFRSWVLKRSDTAFIPRTNYTAGLPSNVYDASINPTTYIQPEQFNYPFVNMRNDGDNFIVQFDFDVDLTIPKSRSIINVNPH